MANLNLSWKALLPVSEAASKSSIFMLSGIMPEDECPKSVTALLKTALSWALDFDGYFPIRGGIPRISSNSDQSSSA